MKTGNYWPRGKMLGGSSGINAMLYVRGNRRDYDHWQQLGNPTWEWNSVLEFFKKSEDNRTPHIAKNSKYHGVGGPLKVEMFNHDIPIKNVMLELITELGYNIITDYNAEENLGFLTMQGTVDRGMRCSAAKAFLIPAANRKNLHIIKYAHVMELNFIEDGSIGGVSFLIDGQSQPLQAISKKEVILSAGALNTPQILMLSGIGPKKQLEELSITVKKDLPVGHNLQDHLIVPYIMAFHKSNAKIFSKENQIDELYNFLVHGKGFFSTVGLTELVGFVSTLNDSKYPDIQYHMFHLHKQQPGTKAIFKLFGYKDEIVESVVRANEEAELVLWIITLLNPKSKGQVSLRSRDPFDTPKIHHNYFLEQDDVDTIVRAIQILQTASHTNTFIKHEGEVVHIDIPGCQSAEFKESYWECYSRHMTSTLYHPVGTAKMGPPSDVEAVVDSQLRVNGINGLRVADASIMPKIVSGNTNAPTIMIGEKAADFIATEWGKTEHSEL